MKSFFSSFLSAWVFLSSLFLRSTAQSDDQSIPYSPCPLLGPRFPQPQALLRFRPIQEALRNLTTAFNNLVAGGDTGFTAATPNTTSFSIGLFSAHETGNDSAPYIWEYHYSAPNFKGSDTWNDTGVKEVNSNSIYNIGGLSHVLTIYSFLIAAGEDRWYDKVSDVIPELASGTRTSVTSIGWDDVRLIDLASYLAGVPRESTLNSLTSQGRPEVLTSILPQSNVSRKDPNPIISRESFFEIIKARRPIYRPGTTPIYSDASIQILAFAIESIMAKPFGSVLNDSVFDPIGMLSSSLGTPQNRSQSDNWVIVPETNTTIAGWDTPTVNSDSTALFASSSIFSTIHDLCLLGRSIIQSTLLSPSATRRWFKPHTQTTNDFDDVGAPWTIFRPTLTGDRTGALVPIYTKLGPNGLYSPYFGIATDYDVGFVILSADTDHPADLNAHADLVSQYMIPALERAAIMQAALAFAGDYTGHNNDGMAMMTIELDGLSGLKVTNWTASNGHDARAAYAELVGIPRQSMDLRLYPTTVEYPASAVNDTKKIVFRAVLQDTAAEIDGGTPTCISWYERVDRWVWNGSALDEFVFEVSNDGVGVAIEVPALEMVLMRRAG